MRSFKDHNPITVFLFYIFAIVPAMFCINPVLMCISLAGAVSFRVSKDGAGAVKKMLPFFVFPVLGMVINPIFNHKGVTTLFILNNNPVTLEAAMFGLTLGVMICSTFSGASRRR